MRQPNMFREMTPSVIFNYLCLYNQIKKELAKNLTNIKSYTGLTTKKGLFWHIFEKSP